MARSILSLVCLSFLLLYKFTDCARWGDDSGSLDSNIGVTSINHNSNRFQRPIIRNITRNPYNTIRATLEIPRYIEYQGRIVSTPPKPGANAIKTIKYRLGARVPGKIQLSFYRDS